MFKNLRLERPIAFIDVETTGLNDLPPNQRTQGNMVIHIFHDECYFGDEQEPFEELSRLLNAALSRARERVVVILPPNPHLLAEPFSVLIKTPSHAKPASIFLVGQMRSIIVSKTSTEAIR